MANISYVRAGASFLPIIGSVVALYNVWEVDNLMPSNSLKNALVRMHIDCNGLIASLPTLAGGVEEAKQKLEQIIDKHGNRHLSAAQKGRVYAICGIVGQVLSIALLVASTVFGIFSGAELVFFGACFIAQAALLNSALYQFNKIIETLKV